MNNSVLIIVDGNRKIGYGHVSRCLIIAEEFKENNFEVVFLQKNDSLFADRISYQYPVYKVDDYQPQFSSEIETIIKENEIGYVIIDLLKKEYRKLEWLRHNFPTIKISTITLFLFSLKDRYEHVSFFPDLLTVAEETKFGKFGKYELYAGPDYLIFRDEFEGIKKTIRKEAKNVLVTMGGTDPKNITHKVIKAFIGHVNINFKVVLSEIAESFSAVKEITDNRENIELIEKTDKISELMVESDLVVLNGGLTRYEVCLARTPFVAISIHEKQYHITKKLTNLGVGINLGVYWKIEKNRISDTVINLLNSYERRKKMSDNMEKLFDTNGAERIFNKIVGD